MSGSLSFPSLATGSAIFGTEGEDVYSLSGPATAYGFGGNDIFRSGGSADAVYGGDGDN
jgi:hypothetical protein